MDKWAKYKKCDDYRVAAPKSVTDLIEIKSIAENGIFEVGPSGIFTKTYTFTDINYSKADINSQIEILEGWCRWLNSNSVPFKITVNNKNRNMQTLREDVFIYYTGDGYDGYRSLFNDEIEYGITNGRAGIVQEMYLTVRYEVSDSYDDAKNFFATLESNMFQAYREIGSTMTPLTASERLRILHDFYRLGEEEYFRFDFRQAVTERQDFKDAITGSLLDFSHEDYFRSDNRYVSAIYLKTLPGTLSDRIITDISKLDIRMMLSIDVAPISDADADAVLKDIYLGVEKRISHQTQNRVKQMDFNSDISLPVQMDKESINTMIKEKAEEDQHFFYVMVNILVIADTLEQLKKNVNLVMLTAKNKSCIFDYSYMLQREALNTVLPIGIRQVNNGRAMQTRALAALFPFNVQELHMPGGFWYGSNTVSKELITVNRKKLLNPHGFIFGVTGSGKTSAGKLEIMQALLKTWDDIIIIDPKNDYADLVSEFGGAYIDISASSNTTFNPLDYYNDGNRINIADEKAELVLSICETSKRAPLTAKESSIINRALKTAFSPVVEQGCGVVTLTDFYNVLTYMGEPEAEDIKLYLELFITGSLNIFSKPTSAPVTGRFVGYGLKNLGTNLRPLAMLVMCEWVKERIMYNAACGRATWLFIDECHEMLKTDYTQNFIKSLWMLIRSLGGIITGLTQNVTDVLLNDTTRALIENSEFLMVLKQKPAAAETVINELGIPEELLDDITSQSQAGTGILSCGSVTVPFNMQIRKNTKLYDIINTSFHDGK